MSLDKLDEPTVWFSVGERGPLLAEQLLTARGADRIRLVYDAARFARLEVSILDSREAIAIQALLLFLIAQADGWVSDSGQVL